MIVFEVNDMRRGHGVQTITDALRAADGRAEVNIDQARHRVGIEPGAADAAALADVIHKAGCTAVAA